MITVTQDGTIWRAVDTETGLTGHGLTEKEAREVVQLMRQGVDTDPAILAAYTAGVLAGREEAAAYLADRARWLREEQAAGGCASLRRRAEECEYLAGQVRAGRKAGGHPR